MTYLILAIVSSTMIAIVMRFGAGDGRKPVLLMNYATCAAVSLGFLGGPPGAEGMPAAAVMGVIGGVLFLSAFLLMQRNIRENGVALASAFMKLGVVVPVTLGFTLFGEALDPLRLCGLLLTAGAIALLAGDGDGARSRGRLPLLIALLLCGGCADGISKFYNAYGDPALEGYFLLLIFAVAGMLCGLLCLREGQRPTGRDVLFGVLLGIPNYFSSRFLLRSLEMLPASVAYPVFSCGTILLSAVSGRVLFNERLGKRQIAAMGLALAALALLNGAG